MGPRLTLGTAQFGRWYGIGNDTGQVPKEEVLQILKYAKNNGVDCLDTGNDYGNAEKIIGESNLNFDIITKLYLKQDSDLEKELALSLTKLRAEKLYGMLIHNPDILFEQPRFLHLLKKTTTKYVGVSISNVEQLRKLLDDFTFNIVELPLNLLNQEFANSGLIQILKTRGIKIYVRSIFLQGLLLMEKNRLGSYFADLVPHLIKIENNALKSNSSVQKLAIEYIKLLEPDGIIFGVDSLKQLKQFIEIYNAPFEQNLDFKQFAISDIRFTNPANWPIGGWR